MVHARVVVYGRKAPAIFKGKLIYSCPSLEELGLGSVSGKYHPCRTPPQIHHTWHLVLPYPDPNVTLLGEGTPFRWATDPIRSSNPILATEVDQKWGTQTTIEGNVEEVRRWWVVEEEREERWMEEFEETREAMDLLVEGEFDEDSSCPEDTSRWIVPYDPSSSQVLIWKGQLIARLMKNANLSCKETADVGGEIEKTVEATSDACITEKETDKGYDINSPILTFMLYHLSNARSPI